MPFIQFSHANGFPAKTYSYLFDELNKQQALDIHYVEAFGLGKYKVEHNWYPLVDELIESIEQHQQGPVVGIGHSLGSFITYWAAQRRPDLFSRVIILDPPYLEWHIRLTLRTLGPLGLTQHILPIAKNALKRRDTFPSKEAAFEYWRPKKLFRNFHPNCFEDYVKHTLIKDETGNLRLLIPKEVESKIFSLTGWQLGQLPQNMPVHWIYGSKTVVSQKVMESHIKSFRDIVFIKMEGGHMFPLEKPTETAKLISNIINGVE